MSESENPWWRNPVLERKVWVLIILLSVVPFAFNRCSKWSQEDEAFDYVAGRVQDTHSLFKDQYSLSMSFDNDRGSLVTLAITDARIQTSKRFLVWVLTKSEATKPSLVIRFMGLGMVPPYHYEIDSEIYYLQTLPSSENIRDLAKREGFL